MPTDEQYQSFLYWLGFDKLLILSFVAIVLLTVAILIMLPSRYQKKKRKNHNFIQRGIRKKMTKEIVQISAPEDSFDPLVKISFKVPFSVREELKKQAFLQGKNFDKFMEDLIHNALTIK